MSIDEGFGNQLHKLRKNNEKLNQQNTAYKREIIELKKAVKQEAFRRKLLQAKYDKVISNG